MANWWDKPFSIEVDGQPWAVLTDKVFLVGIQQSNKLPPLEADDFIRSCVNRMLRTVPTKTQVTSVKHLQTFAEAEDFITILGVQVNTELLLRALSKAKGHNEVELWDASNRDFVWRCLGLVAKPNWKAYLMGLKDLKAPAPVYEPQSIDPMAAFDGIMGELSGASDSGSSS